jgi:hypothetical protein
LAALGISKYVRLPLQEAMCRCYNGSVSEAALGIRDMCEGEACFALRKFQTISISIGRVQLGEGAWLSLSRR